MNVSRCLILWALWSLSTLALAQTCPEGNPRVAPDSRYTISEPVAGQQVVVDIATGFMWKRCSEGRSGVSCTGAATTHTWTQALTLANAATYAGFNDWRLPNREELRSLVETGCYSPSINAVAFPSTVAFFYWTSTTFRIADGAWFVGFASGDVDFGSKLDVSHVRLVRGGQSLDVFDSGDFLLRDGFE
jgi:hypothetical protein